MKYQQRQRVSQSGKNFIRNGARVRGSATGTRNDIFVQKDDGWICSLCYEPVKPMTKDTNGYYNLEVVDMDKKIMWVNKNGNSVHRKQIGKQYGRNSFKYVCVMSHFEKTGMKEFPVDENGCCDVCNSKLIQTSHPVYKQKKIYLNMKDSKPHFRRHKLKWICVI